MRAFPGARIGRGAAGFALALALGCAAPDPPGTPLPPVPAPTPPPTPDEDPPWWRTGEVGEVVLVHPGPDLRPTRWLRVGAVFADGLQDLPYPAACDRLGLLCLPAGLPHETLAPTDGVGLDPEASRFSWVGDSLRVGPFGAPFRVDPAHPTGGYSARYPVPDLLPDRVDLGFEGGEWGDALLPNALPVPAPLGGLSPDPLQPVLVGEQLYQRFTWAPSGGSMVLTLRQGSRAEARTLDDDGEVLVDLRERRFDQPLWVDLWRIDPAERHEVNGNTLDLRGAAVQSWCVLDTDRAPFEAFPVTLEFTFCWASSATCGQSRWFLAPDGTWTSADGYTGTWRYDGCLGELHVLFTSGTHYRASRTDEGCFDGTMQSWSGSLGTWAGCPSEPGDWVGGP